jgi:voltage-gated potassium channel
VTETSDELTPAQHRRMITFGLLRAVVISTVLMIIYFTAPLDRMNHTPLWVSLTVDLLALSVLTVYQIRAILKATHPAVRAVEALAVTAPLFLILFAASYFLMAQDSASNFNVHALTRTDALYFTVTVFATVGFGDIVGTSQAARVLITVQMILNLVVIGLVVRLFFGAVRKARKLDPTDQI